MQQITRWKPDTCECIIEYSWNDAENENIRTYTVHNISRSCFAHVNLADKIQHYEIVKNENTRKNIIFGEILKNVSTVVEEITQEDGTRIKKLKPGLKYEWSFNADRKLIIDLVGFTLTEKNTINNLANTLFPNKVQIK